LAVPREIFVPEFAAHRGLEAVYRDEAIMTKRDVGGMPVSSSSQPAIMASMLERLDLREGQSVLEIGAGTGYNAALLAEIVGPEGRVVSVELDPELAKRSGLALRRAGYRAKVVVGDGHDGWAPQAPYDRIIVTCGVRKLGLEVTNPLIYRQNAVLASELHSPRGRPSLDYNSGHAGDAASLAGQGPSVRARRSRGG
jgi:protein-L-isoaspartate(D-aspartate) O-methyltransferase